MISVSSLPMTSVSNIAALTGQTSTAGGGNQSVKDVVDKLAQSVTKDGKLDTDSPLGKMVSKEMPQTIAGYGGRDNTEAIRGAVEKLVKDKLGDNFGAAEGMGLGGGAGRPDLMTQALSGLGKASLDDVLQPAKGKDGCTTFSDTDKPTMQKVAEFMDQNPAKFPPPDSGSWKKEISEDKLLNKNETASFRAAMDLVGRQLEQTETGVSAPPGGGLGVPSLGAGAIGGSGATTPTAGPNLAQLLGGLVEKSVQSALGGAGGGGGQGAPVSNTSQPALGAGAAQDLNKLLSGLAGNAAHNVIGKGLEVAKNIGDGQLNLQTTAAHAADAIVALMRGGDSPSLS